MDGLFFRILINCCQTLNLGKDDTGDNSFAPNASNEFPDERPRHSGTHYNFLA